MEYHRSRDCVSGQPRLFYWVVGYAMKNAGLPVEHIQQCEGAAPIEQIQLSLGHSSVQTTERYIIVGYRATRSTSRPNAPRLVGYGSQMKSNVYGQHAMFRQRVTEIERSDGSAPSDALELCGYNNLYSRQERWGMERRHAYRLMGAAKAVENMSNWTQTVLATEL